MPQQLSRARYTSIAKQLQLINKMADIHMRFACCVCHDFSAPRFETVLRHIQSVHSWDSNFHLTCGVDGCPKTYKSYRCFCKHILSSHGDLMMDTPDSVEDTNDAIGDEYSSVPSEPGGNIIPKHSAALFLLRAKEQHKIPQSALDGIVGDFSEILRESITSFGNQVKGCVRGTVSEASVSSEVDRMVTEYSTPFEGIGTQYLQKKYYSTHFNLVEPVERRLGQISERITKQNESHIKLSWEVCYEIPLLKSLEQLLSDEHILSEIVTGHQRDDEFLEDFCDGRQFREHPLFSEDVHALQIMLYFDEVEICNPLGPSAKIHKLGLFYYQLGNLSPQYRSSLRSIQLLAIAESHVIVKYGSNKILESFMDDLRKLEEDCGVEFQLNGEKRTFRGTLTLACGDNLGSFFIGGFKQLSSAMRKCRHCMAVASDMSAKFYAEDFQMRTRRTHQQQCSSLGGPLHDHVATTYGLHHNPILNTSRFYHVTDGLPPDIMHDILEGCLQYEVKELLKYLFRESRLDWKTMNERLTMFPFVRTDKDNKPSPISQDTLKSSNHLLKQTASKMWCLARFLPLMIGDLVPEDDENWKLFLLLLPIMDYVFAPKTSLEIVAYVRVLISDHHTKFVQLYKDCTVTPKMHYMIHIPTWMERCGPMTRYWCMRYEAKHSYFKDLAQKIKCFKNMPKSLADRHQHLTCYNQQQQTSLVKEMHLRQAVKEDIENFEYSDVLLQSGVLSSCTTDVYRTKWIQLKGSRYSKGCVVVLNRAPTFAQLVDMLIFNTEEVVFVCEVLTTVAFVVHFHAFEVCRTQPCPLAFCKLSDFADYQALGLYAVNDYMYVVPKYYVEEL